MASSIPVLITKCVETITDRCFINYTTPPTLNEDGAFPMGAKDEWLERVEFLIADLTWLLDLDQKEFWYQMIHKLDIMTAIVSFLQEATPYYMMDYVHYDQEMWKTFQKIRYIVFLIFQRLLTSKESETEQMSLEEMGKELYNNYLLTVPIMLDFCLVYAEDNRAKVSHMIDMVFRVQPNYKEDLIKAVPFFVKVLRTVERSFVTAAVAPSGCEPMKLSERNDRRLENEMGLIGLRDMTIHILDTAATLCAFLDVYTSGCNVLHDQLFEMK